MHQARGDTSDTELPASDIATIPDGCSVAPAKEGSGELNLVQQEDTMTMRLVMKSLLALGFAGAMAGATNALAAPVNGAAIVQANHEVSQVVQAKGGCGSGLMRNASGQCVPKPLPRGLSKGTPWGKWRPR
jgi:hypothetical protein